MSLRPILILMACSLGFACGGPAAGGRAPKGGPSVVATVFPLAEAARAVAGSRADVSELVPPGVEPHDVELAPGQVELLHDADLVVAIPGFQPAVDDVIESRAGPVVAVPPVRGDPHVWLDVAQMKGVAARIRGALARLEPGSASDFARNEEGFARTLEELERRYSEELAGCRGRTLLTTHDAFGLLARYGLRPVAITGRSPEAEPDPARLAELADLARREGVRTIFTEPLVASEVAETLAREAGARTAVLDPIEGPAEAQIEQGVTYLSLMQENLSALTEGLGC